MSFLGRIEQRKKVCPSVIINFSHFWTSPPQPLNEFQRNLTKSKYSRFSTKIVLKVPISEQTWMTWSLLVCNLCLDFSKTWLDNIMYARSFTRLLKHWVLRFAIRLGLGPLVRLSWRPSIGLLFVGRSVEYLPLCSRETFRDHFVYCLSSNPSVCHTVEIVTCRRHMFLNTLI